MLSTNPAIDALAFADAGGGGPNLRLLDGEAGGRAQLGAVCRELIGAGAPPAGLELAGDEPLEALLRWLSLHTSVQWRQLARRGRRGIAGRGDQGAAAIGSPPQRRAGPGRGRSHARPGRPGASGPTLRCGQPDSLATIVDAAAVAPAVPARLFGLRALPVHQRPRGPAGLEPPLRPRLRTRLSLPRNDFAGPPPDGQGPGFRLGEEAELNAPELLGFVEQAPMPLFDSLQIGRHRVSGQAVLIAGAEDPLAAMVDELRSIGYIEPYPVHRCLKRMHLFHAASDCSEAVPV